MAETLRERGVDVVAASADQVRELAGFDAVIVGGALYASRWTAVACRFVARNVAALRKLPVWFFSSGPLDDSADGGQIEATHQVGVLAERVGALGHVTFGGRLSPDAKGFPASAMAKEQSGDWRNPERIRAWAAELATKLPAAVPGTAVDHQAGSLASMLSHAVLGWTLCAATMVLLLRLVSLGWALAIHALAAPLVFALLSWRYFRAWGARDPVPTALTWTIVVAVLDLVVVAGAIQRSFTMFASFTGTWLPLALVFLATWITGEVIAYVAPAQRPHSGR